nr:immunoglobulin heavy chain junction region [Macaca mulatta]MOV39347.1 immunoglobulin heavy chain junction region [Macaca mulatta]MOV39361.1 immunoglobulin heavy chain junction region [Macaca mulatta]MOV40517.1 immunoglobulin heavy chain junction region [Macaca mulatta]MOV40745.1 immunoglobulin heavy chain junction region [Macaca mulatta]
CASLLRPFDYW